MGKRNIIIILAILATLVGAFFVYNSRKESSDAPDQVLLEKTYDISQKYIDLRFRTENVLTKLDSFPEYDDWSNEMTSIIASWKDLENEAVELEKIAQESTGNEVSLSLVKKSFAYDKQEINRIIDSAPFGKKIMTLAKHLGTDAKHAQLILNQTQDEVSREAYGEEGDVFEKCEQNSMRIKNGAKVAGFVGGVVLTGGASAVVASGALATTATVVVGADLVLEVTEDEARIALGDKNKVSEMVSSVRSVTEPAAAILSITNIPGNLSKGIDKLSALSFGADQVRSVIQDEKVLGISIKTDEKGEIKAEIAGLSQEELPTWKEENNVVSSNQSVEEIIDNAKQLAQEIETRKQVSEDKQPEKDEEQKDQAPRDIDSSIQNIKVTNVSSDSYMMDMCFTPKCWDDLAANPAEDLDLGGIYTLGKVFANGEGFERGFRPGDLKASGRLVETSPNSYKFSLYFAIAPFEGPKHRTINYGTWLSESVEINANYGDEVVVEWDGSSLKQAK